MKIDKNYFLNYGGKGKSYNEYFLKFFGSLSTLKKTLDTLGIHPKSCYDVGAGTGALLQELWNIFDFDFVGGCEINKWACEHLVSPDLNIEHCDLFKLKPIRTYDMIISNASMYIEAEDLPAYYQKIRLLGHKNSIYIFVHCSDITDGFWWVNRSGKLVNECLDAFDPYRIINRPYIWWLNSTQSNGFRIINEDKLGVLYAVKGKSKLIKYPSHCVPIFPSPEEVYELGMANLRSPFFIVCQNKKISTNVYNFRFYWNKNGTTVIEWGGIVPDYKVKDRQKLIPYVVEALISKTIVPAVSVIFRPTREFVYKFPLRNIVCDNLWYQFSNPSLTGSYMTDREIIKCIKEES